MFGCIRYLEVCFLKERRTIRFAPGFDRASRQLTLQERLFPPKKVTPRFGEGSGRSGGGRTGAHSRHHLDCQVCQTILPKLSFPPTGCPKCMYEPKLWRLWIEWSAFKREPFLDQFDLLSDYSRYWYEPNACPECATIIHKREVSPGYRVELGKGWIRCECLDSYLEQLRIVTPDREAFETFVKDFEARHSMATIIALCSPEDTQEQS
jgi:hypothetical protein